MSAHNTDLSTHFILLSVYGLFKYNKFEVLTVLTMKIVVFWDVMPGILLEMYKNFSWMPFSTTLYTVLSIGKNRASNV